MEENPTTPTPPPIESPSPPIDTLHQSNWLLLVFVTTLLFAIVFSTLSRYGNLKSQSWYVTAVCIIGWFFPFWIVFLLPLDLASTVHDDNKNGRIPFAYVSQEFLFVAWRVIYWTSFCLTWMMIPMMQAYVNTGDFTISKRLKSALHVNLKFYSIYIVVGIIGLFYLVFGSGLTTRQGIQSYVMAAANSWGLFLVIVFMGYGLVSVPRSLWYSGNYVRHLHQHYGNAAKLKEECMDSEIEFNEIAKTMNSIYHKQSIATIEQPSELKYCIDTMVTRFPFVLHEAFGERDPMINIPRDLTEDYLVKLSRRMVLAIRMRDRKNALWKNLLNEAFYLQDIISNKDRKDRRFTSSLRSKRINTRRARLSASLEWWWILRIQPNLNKALAIFFSIISTCIIWSELVFNVRKPVLSIVSYVLNACDMNYAALEIMAFITLLYMCICVYSSLFKIRFFNLYLLIPNHHTDENSLLWFTGYMCKMMAPLCYNFINLGVDAPGVSRAVFTTFMGKADLIKFLGAFADWFPIIILIPSLSLLFNVQGRFLGLCGIKNPYQNNDNDDLINGGEDPEALIDADYEEGAKLVQEERKMRERDINPGARVAPQSVRNREYANKKYNRGNAYNTDSLRSERDRRVDEILSGRSSNNNSPYHDEDTGTSPGSSIINDDHQNTDFMKLTKTNLVSSFGDSVKHKLGGLFGSLKGSAEDINNSASSNTIEQQQPQSQTHDNNNITSTTAFSPTPSLQGRVFGRANNNVINENHRPFAGNDNNQDDINDNSPMTRSISPNPFLMASSGLNSNRQVNNTDSINRSNSSVSPFARFGGNTTNNNNNNNSNSNSNSNSRISNNIFDDI